MKYSVVIPVYNSVSSLPHLAERIDKVFKERIRDTFEIIFVDDHSPNPETWKELKEITEKTSVVSCIRLSKNFGQQSATLCGMANAKGDYIITMDDDLQHLPEDIPKLISEKKNHDIVIAHMKNKKHSLFKRVTSRLKGYFDYLLIGKPRDIQLSSFRLINRSTIDGMLKIRTSRPFIPALMFYVSKNVSGVTLDHAQRFEGSGNYSLRKLFSLFSNLLINNSSFLLRAIGLVGIIIAFLAFCVGIFFILKKLMNDETPVGYTSVIVSVLFMGGMILFAVGIIGEYLVRIIAGVEQKPSYVIKEIRHGK